MLGALKKNGDKIGKKGMGAESGVGMDVATTGPKATGRPVKTTAAPAVQRPVHVHIVIHWLTESLL